MERGCGVLPLFSKHWALLDVTQYTSYAVYETHEPHGKARRLIVVYWIMRMAAQERERRKGAYEVG